MSASFRARLVRNYPFMVVFALELLLMVYLWWERRVPPGHDAFQYFGVQYYFLNNAAFAGETAQWMPFMTQGTVANWWFCMQNGLVEGALLALGPLLVAVRGLNFLLFYDAGMFFDLTVLLLGVCLLGRRYYSSKQTILFVAVTMLGSSIYYTQPWYGLHYFYALPLMLHFLHGLLETGRWRYFFLLGNLFVVQLNGSLPYFLPMQSLALFLYALFYVAVYGRTALGQIERLLRRWIYAVLPVAGVALSLYILNMALTEGTKEIVNYNAGRNLNGEVVSVNAFLTYGANPNMRWQELLTRVSPCLDYHLYFGYFGLALAALGFTFKPNRLFLVLALTTLVLLLISLATPVASLMFFAWPKMNFYRHLSLVSNLVRFFLCLLAGFGFEQLLIKDGAWRGLGGVVRSVMAATTLGEVAVVLAALSFDALSARQWIWAQITGHLPLAKWFMPPEHMQPVLVEAALWSAAATLVFGLLASRKLPRPWLAWAVIALQAADLYTFKFEEANIMTVPLTPEQYAVNRMDGLPYAPRRTPIDYATQAKARLVPQIDLRVGAAYWSLDTYLLTDPPINPDRTDHWLKAYDDFLRTYSGETIRDFSRRPIAKGNTTIIFDWSGTPAKLGGVTEDKIQFFTTAHQPGDDKEISRLMRSPDYRGDLLFVSKNETAPSPPPPAEAALDLGKNERVAHDHQVLQYDANHLKVEVEQAKAGDWLYYADVWHPFWSVSVNGAPAPLYKGSLAYKAVPLQAGKNVVTFTFGSPLLGWCMKILNFNALFWVLFLVYLFYREWTTKEETAPVQPT